MIDLGTGNNNKMCVHYIGIPPLPHGFECAIFDLRNWAMDNKQEVCKSGLIYHGAIYINFL